MADTRERLLLAAVESLGADGIAGVSARAVAARADVNQALVFYHFGTVSGLLDAAVRASADASLEQYRQRFAQVRSLVELLQVGREMHIREREQGNVAVMAQLLAGAQQDGALADAARYAIGRWRQEIEIVLRRVLAGNPVADLIDPASAATAISAGFIGLELYEGVDPVGAAAALDSVASLGTLLEIADDLGPVARRAIRARLRRRPTR